MYLRSLLLLLAILALPFATATGQESDKARTGTPYSSIGLGMPSESYSPVSAGMGLSGVSLLNAYSANSVNPAMWGLSGYTQGVVTANLNTFTASDASGSSVGYRQFGINQFQVVLPLVRSRFGLSVGFQPVTQASFELSSTGTFEPDIEEITYLNRIRGSGGVNKLEGGIGYRLNEYLALGYAGSLHFSTLNRETDLLFDSSTFRDLNFEERISGYAIGHKFGLYGRLPSLFGSSDVIAVGATASLPVTISADQSYTSYRDVGNRHVAVDLLPENESGAGEIEIPLEFNLGLTYNPTRLLDLSAEYLQQHWGDSRYSFSPDQERYLTDRTRMGLGLQFHPYMREGEPGFLSRFRYSAGVSWDSGHLLIEEQQVETLMFHAGLGILSGRQASSVDLSFQLGFRGTTESNLVQETIWGFRLSVNLAEWMFRQTRFQ